ncbi:flagellar biosynthetic protein FliO [Undibacterium seohonense]|jgi:flagellar protein FliO/FliZ|uniref:Flagellar protein n=1 Tax=Undibacterium seohonense TaxID=1344950 RepID=A0ABR6X894_9BURK|nr:flagellar biosynthetic protein FliO [Undibacterium seohonense]MBC3809072.1 flagellar biosynthetic protein FliO [Undibacterium seohonense]
MTNLIRYFCLALMLPTSAYAQANAVSPSTGLLQIFLALVVVIGIMLLLAWLVKRVGPIASGHKLPVKVIGGISIGNRERVMVIEVADQWLVLGVTAQQINTLASMPKQELPDTDHNAITATAPFADWLKKTLEKRNTPQN